MRALDIAPILEWLAVFLLDWRRSEEVKQEAAHRGISEWALRCACKELGVVKERAGWRAAHGSWWIHPDGRVLRTGDVETLRILGESQEAHAQRHRARVRRSPGRRGRAA